MKQFFGLAFAAALALGAGCGDDSGAGDAHGNEDGGGGEHHGAEPVSEMITAAAGGEVTTEGAALDIPAGGLADDTEITVEVVEKDGLPGEDDIASDVYDFGPDGTMFEKPVTLTIDFDPAAAPKGMVGAIAFLDGKEWVALEDSEVSGDQVVATTDHFTKFAVIWTAEGAVQTEGQCDSTAFEACGGDLVGTWELTIGCLTLPADALTGDLGKSCPDVMVEANLDITGSVVFEAGGDFSADLAFAQDVTITIPKSCLPMGATCEGLAKEGEPAATDTGDACAQSKSGSEPVQSAGTWKLSADMKSLIVTDEEGEDPPTEFCVKTVGGKTTLTTYSAATAEDPEIMWVAEKQ